MNRFGRGTGTGKFSALLRSAGRSGINMPGAAETMSTPGAGKPYKAHKQKMPSNKAALRHMDAKDKASAPPSGADRASRMREGAGAAGPWPNRSGVRIAQGSTGISGRQIHFPNSTEGAGDIPGHVSVGPKRSGSRSGKKSKNLGSSGMSKTIGGRPGVPAHISVGPKRGMSASRRLNMASKLQY